MNLSPRRVLRGRTRSKGTGLAIPLAMVLAAVTAACAGTPDQQVAAASAAASAQPAAGATSPTNLLVHGACADGASWNAVSTGTAVEYLVDPKTFPAVFAGDLPADQAAVLAAEQRPAADAAFSEPSGVPAWKSLPS